MIQPRRQKADLCFLITLASAGMEDWKRHFLIKDLKPFPVTQGDARLSSSQLPLLFPGQDSEVSLPEKANMKLPAEM